MESKKITPELDQCDRHWMAQALDQAAQGGNRGEVPVGAVLIGPEQTILARTHNRKEQWQDPTAHAEMLALRSGSRILGNWHLHRCTLYVTLEPCPMCAGAIIHSRLGRLVYGASDPKTGVIRTVDNFGDRFFSNHRFPIRSGVLEDQCQQLLHHWFQRQRQRPRPQGHRPQ